jgi:hypothetical protein
MITLYDGMPFFFFSQLSKPALKSQLGTVMSRPDTILIYQAGAMISRLLATWPRAIRSPVISKRARVYKP